MRRFLVLLSALLVAAPASVIANQQPSADYVIVALKSRPLASYEGGLPGLQRTKPLRGKLDPSSPAYTAYARHLANEHATYRAFLQKNAPRAEVVREYSVVLNGFALRLNGTDPSVVARHERVRSVDNSWIYRPTMAESVDLIHALAGWTALGGRADAGTGIRIGIIDSGIDDSHPFFACKGDIPHKVYASGAAASNDNPIYNPHGTHVAGTAAGCVIDVPAVELLAGQEISGVAPGASLADYNVFPSYGAGFVGRLGEAFVHDIAAALEDAVMDGMDIVNMSLGGQIQGPHDYLAEASDAAVDAGVVVVAAAGNDGPGAGTVGSPANAEKVISAASSTNSHFAGVPVLVTDGDDQAEYIAVAGEFDPFEATPATDAPLVSWGGDELACTAVAPATFTGSVVLIKRGTCFFSAKVANAAAAGAVGVVVYNHEEGGAIPMAGSATIPAVMVSLADGTAIKALMAAAGEPLRVTITGREVMPADGPDELSDFSSRGPGGFVYNIKPDVVAPGQDIYSSVLDDGWEFFDGTSMASPHVAGAAALVLAAAANMEEPLELTPADVKSLLVNNADRIVDSVDGEAATVMEQGGGRINIERALHAEVTFDPPSLGFGRHNGNRQVSVTIPVTITDLACGETIAVDADDPNITLGGDPASGRVTATLSVRGASNGEGDIQVSCGDRSYLLPYWYSTGNTAR